MKKYVLLGSKNPNPSKHRMGIIQASDDYSTLVKTWETIDTFYRCLGETFEDRFSTEALEMMDRHPGLEKLFDIYFDSLIWTVEVIGIFEARKIDERFHPFFD